MVFGSIFSFVQKGVEQVLDTITQQGRVVTDQVQSPITSMMSTITSGAWEGDDADAFVNEIQSVLLPMVAELIAAIAGVGGGITNAASAIQQRDQKVRGFVEDLGDMFGQIF